MKPYCWKNEKTGLFDIRYELPRRDDLIDPKTGLPKRRRTTKRGVGRTEGEARKWHAVNVVAAQARGEFVDRSADTLGSWIEGWWRSHRHEVKTTTATGYEISINSHIVPALGNVKLQDLTPGRLSAFYATLLESGHRQRQGQGLSPRTVRQIHAVVRMALAAAVDEGKLVANPADKAKAPKSKRTERESRRSRTFYTAEQVGTLIEASREHRLGVAIRLSAMTGLRRGELLGLRWQDIDLDAGTLTVVQTLLAPRYVLQLSTPKSMDSERTIALDDATVAALRAHRAEQNRERLAFGKGWGDHPLATDLVFRDELGGPIKPALFSLAFAGLVRKAGLPQIRLHDVRHSHAALLALSGASPQEMQERLGHHSAAFTLSCYGGLYKDRDKRAADGVAALVAGGRA